MPKLLLVERAGAVLPRPAPSRSGRPQDVLVRMKLDDSQFWRFLLDCCELLGLPQARRPKRQAG